MFACDVGDEWSVEAIQAQTDWFLSPHVPDPLLSSMGSPLARATTSGWVPKTGADMALGSVP